MTLNMDKEFASLSTTDKDDFLDKTKAARLERQKEKELNTAAIIIQVRIPFKGF